MNQTKEWLKFRKSQFADTSHIRACQKVFAEHIAACERCLDHLTAYDCGLCDVGQAAFDEIAAAITANPSCEILTAAEACASTAVQEFHDKANASDVIHCVRGQLKTCVTKTSKP